MIEIPKPAEFDPDKGWGVWLTTAEEWDPWNA